MTDDARWDAAVRDALTSRGVGAIGIDAGAPATDFVGAAEQLGRAARDAGGVDAVVVARTGVEPSRAGAAWARVLDEHSGIVDALRSDVAWVRAVSDHARESGRPMRVVTVTDATTSGGKSRAQAAAQLSRAAHLVTEIDTDAFAVGVESDDESLAPTVGELVGYLVAADDASAISGAELVATSAWIGLRSHPHPDASISFGGPEVPSWVDDTLRTMAETSSVRRRA